MQCFGFSSEVNKAMFVMIEFGTYGSVPIKLSLLYVSACSKFMMYDNGGFTQNT